MAAFAKRHLLLRKKPAQHGVALLWPVHAYRVQYAEAQGKTLNLFQRAVLGLARAGCREPLEMSTLLGLHQQMVLLILAQCNSHAWIDSQGRPTENGLALLDEEEDRSVDLKAGVLFRDALSGAFWPRIVSMDGLSEIESAAQAGELPMFRLNRAEGGEIRPHVFAAHQDLPAPFDTRDIQQAYRAYRLDYFNARQLYGRAEVGAEVRAQGIELMHEQAEPMYVLTWVTPDQTGERSWRVCDPLALRQQVPWLDDTFDSLLSQPRQQRLARRLATMIGKPQAEQQNVKEWMQQLEQELDLELLTEHPWAGREKLIGRYFRVLSWRTRVMEQAFGRHELESALTDAQKLCEAVCQWIVRRYPGKTDLIPNVGYRDRALNERLLEATELPALTPELIRRLASQDTKKVRDVLRGRSESLKAMLFAALVTTMDEPEHPFRHLAPEALAFDRLIKLADLRNEATHASGKEFHMTEVVQAAKFALQWTSQLKEWM
ncbi:hypothetical protein [Massilia niastensis]|uniref:hypothetical protein n=1 Tax=Massilia niastensis TaxID=544911 RepID=UPI0003648809|nr:hypothetical protein [Massilia niastensis]